MLGGLIGRASRLSIKPCAAAVAPPVGSRFPRPAVGHMTAERSLLSPVYGSSGPGFCVSHSRCRLFRHRPVRCRCWRTPLACPSPG